MPTSTMHYPQTGIVTLALLMYFYLKWHLMSLKLTVNYHSNAL